MDLRRRFESGSALSLSRPSADSLARTTARVASKVVFVVILVGLFLVAAKANSIVLAAIVAGIGGLFLRELLPTQRIRLFAGRLLEGDAGESAYDRTRSYGERTVDRFRWGDD